MTRFVFLLMFVLLLLATAVHGERVIDIVTSTGETLKGKVHGNILIMRDGKFPVIGHIREEVTPDDFSWSSYRNSRCYVMYVEGVGKIYLFPTELVSKEGKGGCMRGKAYIQRDHTWLRKNEPDYLREKRHGIETWTSAIWSWRTLGWDEDNGKDPVWGGKAFLKED